LGCYTRRVASATRELRVELEGAKAPRELDGDARIGRGGGGDGVGHGDVGISAPENRGEVGEHRDGAIEIVGLGELEGGSNDGSTFLWTG
jgi:hypothetical protein